MYKPINQLAVEELATMKFYEIMYCYSLYTQSIPNFTSTVEYAADAIKGLDPHVAEFVMKAMVTPQKEWESQEFRDWAVAHKNLLFPKE